MNPSNNITTLVSEDEIWAALEKVQDPEIPVLSVVDMGIITSVGCRVSDVGCTTAEIVMTPTFVGCPAIDVMKKSVYDEVKKLGFDEVIVKADFDVQWNSDMMKPGAKEKLEKFGLAPPPSLDGGELTAEQLDKVRCPHCHSTDTTLRSAFGSTLCRAIRFCFNCKQGFEQFKPIS